MAESGKTDFIFKKSYEISYALWRIAAAMSERNFADKLFAAAVELIGDVSIGNYAAISAKIPGLEFLIKFGLDVNVVGIKNADILFQEIGNLKAAIAELPVAGITEEVDIAGIFSKESEPIDFSEPEYISHIFEETGNDNGNSGKAEVRQSAILERIRQSGNCRLNDIQAILPDTSERTLRYDLETLVQKNLIERIGTGGRGTYYQAKS
jgi:hypothetical protein